MKVLSAITALITLTAFLAISALGEAPTPGQAALADDVLSAGQPADIVTQEVASYDQIWQECSVIYDEVLRGIREYYDEDAIPEPTADDKAVAVTAMTKALRAYQEGDGDYESFPTNFLFRYRVSVKYFQVKIMSTLVPGSEITYPPKEEKK